MTLPFNTPNLMYVSRSSWLYSSNFSLLSVLWSCWCCLHLRTFALVVSSVWATSFSDHHTLSIQALCQSLAPERCLPWHFCHYHVIFSIVLGRGAQDDTKHWSKNHLATKMNEPENRGTTIIDYKVLLLKGIQCILSIHRLIQEMKTKL